VASSHSATVVVVGAGVTGLSTSYHLARRNFGRIILIDKGPVGDGSSQRAAAIITGHLWTEAGVRVRKRCLELYGELSDTLPGYRFRQAGCLNLFDAASWADRKPLLPLYDKLSVPYQQMNPAEILRRWPALHPREDAVGLFDPLGGYSEPAEYIPALRAHVEQLGVEVREYQSVTGMEVKAGAVKGIRTAEGLVEADAVVSTVYCWTRPVLETVGITLPVKSFVHQRFVTAPLPEPIEIPAVNANPYMGYFRPAPHGAILAGIETADRDEYVVDSLDFHQSQLTISPDLKNRLRTNLQPFLPALAAVNWVSEKIGLITFSMDGEPILGPVPSIAGLFVGVGFHSGGFAYNPGTGELLADYVMRGKPAIDVSSWSVDRFNTEETRRYVAERLKQKDVVRRRH
jgi:sarcosine oxidase, subunit beta